MADTFQNRLLTSEKNSKIIMEKYQKYKGKFIQIQKVIKQECSILLQFLEGQAIPNEDLLFL
jgi:hypothetical protein